MGADCQPGAVQWIEKIFNDCVYSPRDLLGFCVGLLSILCWLFAQVPQLIKNYRTQSAEALSPWFLAEWLLGDTFNLVGSLLKGDQPQSVVLTAQYFCLMDVVLLVQYLYYQALARRRERLLRRRERRRRHHHHHHPHGHHALGSMQQQGEGEVLAEVAMDGPGPLAAAGGAAGAAAGSSSSSARDVSFRPTRAPLAAAVLTIAQAPRLVSSALGATAVGAESGAARRMLAFSTPGIDGLGLTLPAWSHTAGSVLGYASSLLYLGSRVSQIYKNWSRRSVEGLAMSMFLFAILANSCYGASILLRTYTWAQLASSLPWLIGSLGTVALDATIFLQSRLLGNDGAKKRESDEEESLLGEEDKDATRVPHAHHSHHVH